jgi:hypothetical protein
MGSQMRENWDFVSMDSYAADMRESASQAASIISAMREEKKQLERLLAHAVKAAGGKITIYETALADPSPIGLKMWRSVADDTLTLQSTS